MAGFLNRHFFAGMAAGMALTIVLLIVGVGVGAYLIMKEMPDDQQLGLMLREPPLPSGDALVAIATVDSARVTSLDGDTAPLSSFRGQVMFINTWATWCQPCRAEMPGIERLYATMWDRPVAFLVVSDEERDRVAKFVSERGLDVPVYVWDGEPPELFRTKTIPATFIVDPSGNVVFKHTGAARWDGAATVALLERLMVDGGK